MWNIESGRPVDELLEEHTGDVACVAFSCDGMQIVSGSDDVTIRVWDKAEEKLVAGSLQHHVVVCVWSRRRKPEAIWVMHGNKQTDRTPLWLVDGLVIDFHVFVSQIMIVLSSDTSCRYLECRDRVDHLGRLGRQLLGHVCHFAAR